MPIDGEKNGQAGKEAHNRPAIEDQFDHKSDDENADDSRALLDRIDKDSDFNNNSQSL